MRRAVAVLLLASLSVAASAAGNQACQGRAAQLEQRAAHCAKLTDAEAKQACEQLFERRKAAAKGPKKAKKARKQDAAGTMGAEPAYKGGYEIVNPGHYTPSSNAFGGGCHPHGYKPNEYAEAYKPSDEYYDDSYSKAEIKGYGIVDPHYSNSIPFEPQFESDYDNYIEVDVNSDGTIAVSDFNRYWWAAGSVPSGSDNDFEFKGYEFYAWTKNANHPDTVTFHGDVGNRTSASWWGNYGAPKEFLSSPPRDEDATLANYRFNIGRFGSMAHASLDGVCLALPTPNCFVLDMTDNSYYEGNLTASSTPTAIHMSLVDYVMRGTIEAKWPWTHGAHFTCSNLVFIPI